MVTLFYFYFENIIRERGKRFQLKIRLFLTPVYLILNPFYKISVNILGLHVKINMTIKIKHKLLMLQAKGKLGINLNFSFRPGLLHRYYFLK